LKQVQTFSRNMKLIQKLLPYFLIAGQVLVFFQVEHRWVQVLMLAFITFQVWKRYRNSAVSSDS